MEVVEGWEEAGEEELEQVEHESIQLGMNVVLIYSLLGFWWKTQAPQVEVWQLMAAEVVLAVVEEVEEVEV